jgi:hypothetical protein
MSGIAEFDATPAGAACPICKGRGTHRDGEETWPCGWCAGTGIKPKMDQLCPRRAESGRYHPEGPLLDRWDADTWVPKPDWKPRVDTTYPKEMVGGVVWKWPWAPRSCSFCGGLHPEDAIRLIEEGFEVEATDKSYKRYLHAPGFRLRMMQFNGYARQDQGEIVELTTEEAEKHARYFSAAPPLKLYVPHFSPEQIERFNAALMKGKP